MDTGERPAAIDLMGNVPRARHATLGADKAYDVAEFVGHLQREQDVVPHVAQNTSKRSSAIDGRTTRYIGYAMSQICRKGVERPFGWGKAAGGIAQVKHRGRRRVGWIFTFAMAVYDLRSGPVADTVRGDAVMMAVAPFAPPLRGSKAQAAGLFKGRPDPVGRPFSATS